MAWNLLMNMSVSSSPMHHWRWLYDTNPVGTAGRQDKPHERRRRMCRTLHSILAVALALLLVASAVALAAEETVSGTVENVDPQQGRMILRAEEGKVMELRAPADLLTGLQNGDAVEVKLSGQRATFIQRQEGVQQPYTGGALRLQPPIDMPKSR